MSKQSEIIPGVIQLIDGCGIHVGLILGGSVGEGRERPDSDVDFFAVVDAEQPPVLTGFAVVSQKNGSTLFERKESDFPVHVACWTTASLDDVLQRKPYMTYPLLRGRIVHDPARLAERYRARIRQYFAVHGSIERAWIQQLDDLRLGKADHRTKPAFPLWSDFIRHIEDAFAKEIGKPSASGGLPEAGGSTEG